MGIAIKRLNEYFQTVQAAGRPLSQGGYIKRMGDLEHKVKINKRMIEGMRDKIKRAAADTPKTKLDAARKQIKDWQAENTAYEAEIARIRAKAKDQGLKRRYAAPKSRT